MILEQIRSNTSLCSAFQGWDRPPPEGQMMKMGKKKWSGEVPELATCSAH